MPAEAPRPAEDATVALAREPGEAADPETAVDLVDALLEVRAARERLRRVDSILAALLTMIRTAEPFPTNAKGLTGANGQAPADRVQLMQDNSDADFSHTAG